LGQALLLAEPYVDAKAVYRRYLEYYPRNGWSLNDLVQALLKQGNSEATSCRFNSV